MHTTRVALACGLVAAACLTTPGLLLAVQVEAEAFVGRPLGVGMVEVVMPERGGEPLEDDRVTLVESGRRVLYPAYEDAPVRRLLRSVFNIRGPRRITVYFLFQGEAPLDLTLYTPQPRRLRVRPVRSAAAHDRLLHTWWQNYTGNAQWFAQRSDYPLKIENYLIPTLARRLDLPLPPPFDEAPSGQLQDAVGPLLSPDGSRATFQRDILQLAQRPPQEASQPLPEHAATGRARAGVRPQALAPRPAAPNRVPPRPAGEELPPHRAPPQGDAEPLPPPQPAPPAVVLPRVEPMASHVPGECFYVRFGSFANYQWLRDFLNTWGGDLRSMITERGLDFQVSPRIERQIGLHANALARWLGPTVIADVAMIGHDPFMDDGAAFGILFQARQNAVLTNDLQSQREAARRQAPGAVEETLKIGGRDVSFIHTPDNRLRSFYVSDGDFHLVTTSRHLVQRFLEAGAGKNALADDPTFRDIRSRMPDDATVFAYASQEFFHQLASPAYRVEMARRLRSLAELEMLRLARLAAKAESIDAQTIPKLVTAGFLPRYFGERPDGSRIVKRDDQLLDSHRGAPGCFIPIADVDVQLATPEEIEAYEQFAAAYRDQWSSFGPATATIRCQQLAEQKLQRLQIALQVSNLSPKFYDRARQTLGEPTQKIVPPLPADLAWAQLTTSGRGVLSLFGLERGPAGPPGLVFGALRDFQMPPSAFAGPLGLTSGLSFIRGYLGAWPQPGVLEHLLGPGPIAFDQRGFSVQPGLLGAWAWQKNGFTVFSFAPDVLADAARQLHVVRAPLPANVRLNIKDLTGTELAGVFASLGYSRARDASAGGAKFVNRLTEQLNLPRGDALKTAETLLNAKIVCPLEGTYELTSTAGEVPVWRSTRVSTADTSLLSPAPEDYELPLLKWFRGVDLQARIVDCAFSGEVVLLLREDAPSRFEFSLPNFLR